MDKNSKEPNVPDLETNIYNYQQLLTYVMLCLYSYSEKPKLKRFISLSLDLKPLTLLISNNQMVCGQNK